MTRKDLRVLAAPVSVASIGAVSDRGPLAVGKAVCTRANAAVQKTKPALAL